MFLLKIIYDFVENVTFLLFLILAIFSTIASSSVLLNVALSIFLSTFNISFSHLQGNLFSGISVDNLSINKKVISKNVDIEWDLFKLNSKNIVIEKLDISKLNKDNLLELISVFDDNKTTKDNKTLDFNISIDSSHISISNFIEQNISIKNTNLYIKNLLFAKNIIYIPSINVQSSICVKKHLIDIKSSNHTLSYNIDSAYLDLNSTLSIDTNYSKNIKINNNLQLDKKLLHYKGILNSDNVILENNLSKYSKYIDNLNIDYYGDKKFTYIKLNTSYIDSNISIFQYQKVYGDIRVIQDIYISEFTDKLPKNINNIKVSPSLKVFYKRDTKKLKIDINSSIANINGYIEFNKSTNIKSKITIPKKSKIKNIDKNIEWKNLSTIYLDVNILEDIIKLKLNSSYHKSNAFYNKIDTSLYAKIFLEKFNIEVLGKKNDKLIINKKINIDRLIKSVNRLYKIDKKLQVNGVINLKATLIKSKDIDLVLSSDNILYKNSKKDKIVLKDIYLSLSKVGTEINLKRYNINYNNFYLFATQPSYITLYNDRLITHSLIVNNEAKIFLDYNLTTNKGEMTLDSKKFTLDKDFVKTNIKANIKGKIDNNKTEITGDISILNGNILYNLNKKRFRGSKDIIILQNQKKKGINFFKDFVFINVNVKTKKPIKYNKKDIKLKVRTDLKIYKPLKGDIAILGEIKIKKNGFYIIKDKKFKFKKSKLYFIGDTSNTILDLRLVYKNSNYTIKISVRGDVSNPIIRFSSNANLSQAEILSVILFDSSTGGDSSDTTELIKMIGGALAKSILANVGIKLDYLVFGANNRVEIGKEIVKGFSIIYVNDEVSSVKLQYKNNSFTTTTAKLNKETQSIDIVFKKRFDKF